MEYRDPTPISPDEIDYDESKVDTRVSHYTKQVREKMHGIDTREAMARAEEISSVVSTEAKEISVETKGRQDILEQQFDDQIANMTLEDPSSAEIVAAQTNRKTGENWQTIGNRLDEENNRLTAELATIDRKKADQSFVDAQFASIVGGAPKATYNTVSALQNAYPNGTQGVFLVLENGHWYYWNGEISAWTDGGQYQSSGIADGGVEIENLETIIKEDLYSTSTKNLYNAYKTKAGYTDCLNNFVINPSVLSSEEITVTSGDIVFFSNDGVGVQVQWLTLLKADGTPYATTANEFQWKSIYTIPEGVTKIIASFAKTYTKFAISKGSILNPYEPFYHSKLTDFQNTLSSYPTPNDIAKLMLNRNMFNKAKSTDGFFINWTNGKPQANTSFWYSDYIEILPNTDYVQSIETFAAIYDENKVFLQGYQNGNKTFKSHVNAKWIRVSSDTSKDTYQIELGTISTTYIPYSYTIKDTNNNIPVILPNMSSNWYKGKTGVCYGDSITQQFKWQPYVVTKLELTSFINRGVGGRLVAWNSGMNMDSQISTLPDANTIDFLTFMGGTNDWANNVPIGNINDTDNLSFYGALNLVAQKLITKYPNKRIIFMTTPYGGLYASTTFTDSGYINTLGLTTQNYAKCVKDIAEKYGFPCIDVYSNAGWNRYNITNYITDDGGYLHPNVAGGKRIAELVIGKLKEIEPIA